MKPELVSPSATYWAAWLADAERRQREVFRLSPERLVAEYCREREVTRGYHGREILELLQNAGDAARQAGSSGKVRIIATPHGLVIGNTGRPFDAGGVRSLQTANLSPKRQSETAVIGDKGLGFRSILNWTHSPLVSSGALGLAFVPDYAAEILRELEQGNAELAALVRSERALGDELIVPRLVFPQSVPDWSRHTWPDDEAIQSIAEECRSLREEGFDTAVGMPFHAPRAHDEAVQQADELRPEFLLLVNSITQLEIKVDGRDAKVWSCERSGDRAKLREDGQELSAWTVSVHEGEVSPDLLDEADRRKSRFQILLAVPDDPAASPSNLFCYFPTEAGVPLPLLVHATVELDETRKHVNDTRANRHILAVAAERIADLAQERLARPGAGAWDGCRLVATKGTWGSELVKFGFPAAIKAAAKTKRLIPVLGGGHESAANAKLPLNEEAGWWPSRLFADMVAVSCKAEHEIAVQLEAVPFTLEELIARALSMNSLTIDERAGVVAGLVRSGKNLPPNGLAPLLCDDAGAPLALDSHAIMQSEREMPLMPAWATIRFLHPDLRICLAVLLAADGRDLQMKLRHFGVVEYSLSALIRPVMVGANRQSREKPVEEDAIRKEALEFLWRVYQHIGGDTPFPADASVRLLNQEEQWTEPQSLYLGEGYGQEGKVTQDLYGGWSKAKLVATPATLGLNAGDGTGWQKPDRFLIWLGVARWPREASIANTDAKFLEAIKDSIRVPTDFGGRQVQKREELSTTKIVAVKTVDGLFDILRNAKPETVLAWMVLDDRASTWTRPAVEHGKLTIHFHREHGDRHYHGPLLSYTHWQIATSPWLPSTAGTNQAPRSCLIGDRQLDALFPSPGHLNPDLLEFYRIADQIHDGFRNAGVMPSLSQLSREELYRLLLEVPAQSPDGKAGRALTRWFVTNDVFVFGAVGPYQERFMREGRIWGTKEGVSTYYPIKELRHVDNEGFPAALTTKLAIADLGKRVGAPKVKTVLGIKPLEMSEIQPELVSHRASTEVERRADWFNKAKPFIKRLRQSQTKQAQAMGLFDRLELIVCDALEVRMRYEQTTYEHSAQEGEFFIFADRLYVRGDLDDSIDLLADTAGTAVASAFDMADGDAFAKILRCESRDRAKLLKRMCGDAFHEVIEEAKTTVAPKYTGPIQTPIAAEASDAGEKVPEEETAPETETEEDERPTSGVVSIPHVPLPAVTPRRIVIQEVQKTTNIPSGVKTVVDGARCERMAMAFEEQDKPRRWVLQVGHITGADAPGVDLVSFNSEEDKKAFETEISRNWNRVTRFIEVKGRSSATAKIELRGNELKAARNFKDRYYLYRFYEEANGQFFVSILQDPVASEEAKTTIVEFDLERAKTTLRYKFTLGAEANVAR